MVFPNFPPPASLGQRYRLSADAIIDIENILNKSMAEFGVVAAERYAKLLSRAIDYIAASPEGMGTKASPELGKGIRRFHINGAKNMVLPPSDRVKKARHVLYYRVRGGKTEIARVLYDGMLPKRHINRNSWL